MSSPNERHVASARRLFLISCFVLLIIVGFIYKVQDNWPRIRPFPSGDGNGNISIKQYAACPIPQLNPFEKSIEHLLVMGPTLDCEKVYPLLFNSTLESTIIPVKGYAYFRKRYESCCYRTVERVENASVENESVEEAAKPDNTERTSEKCFPLSLTSPTNIPEEHEFIGIFCRLYGDSTLDAVEAVDAHAFVHLKPKMGVKKAEGSETGEKLNVIIFGLDATSRMNFIRFMPQSYSFLKEEMGGVEMLGYNKVGENTFPNLMAMLTSQKLSELGCTYENGSLNDCPFIWNEYSKQGYYTSFADDSPQRTTFSLGSKGFSRQPTDYYLRPLSRWAEENVGSFPQQVCQACFGPRITFQYLLDYLEKFVRMMSRSRKTFFQFIWSSGLTHDYQGTAQYGDVHLLNSLKWLRHSGHLNNTVLIVMSDHGYRMGSFRQTIQGQLEERLPLLFFVVPDSFKKKYQRAYQNLLANRDKLVTPFDIHATLEDILNLTLIQDASLQRRELETYSAEKAASLPRQLSLFLPIPESRTCAMAGIDVNFCSCNYLRLASLQDPVLKNVSKAGVSYLNSILANHTRTRCAQLQLKNVTMAQRTGASSLDYEAYLINFDTEPGGGQFEAMIGKTDDDQDWSVQGKIIRTNWYMNQSHCVNDYTLKPYCYCLD